MRPYLPELTIRDYNIYLQYLRGVRRQLYEDAGELFSGSAEDLARLISLKLRR